MVYYESYVSKATRILFVRYFCLFFAHKKYFCHLITLRLNHCSHIDYFNDVFTTFLDLQICYDIAVIS